MKLMNGPKSGTPEASKMIKQAAKACGELLKQYKKATEKDACT